MTGKSISILETNLLLNHNTHKNHMKIENNTLLGHYVRWGAEISENIVSIPAGEYVEQNGRLVLLLDSGEPSTKHSYIPVQQ